MTKIKVKSESTITDFVTRKQRLTKAQPKADFRLADNDDFFGYSTQEGYFTFKELVVGAIIGLPVLYVIVYVLLAMTPNI